jgi:hypothetical protein
MSEENLTRKETKIMERMFKPKPIKREDEVNMMGALKMTWYFEGFWNKFILSLAMFSLLYSIVRIIVQGFW